MFISVTRRAMAGNVCAKNFKEAYDSILQYVGKLGLDCDSISHLEITVDPGSTSLEPSFSFEVIA